MSEAQVETPTTEAENEEMPVVTPGMQWYTLQASTNLEHRVAESMIRRTRIEAMENQIGRIVVPSVAERRVRGGKAKIINRKLYPGYVFIEIAPEDDGSIPEDVWYLIQETDGAIDIIGGRRAAPLSEPEAAAMLQVALARKPTSNISLAPGQTVRVTDGSFESYEGKIMSVDQKHGTAAVDLIVFGRPTEVALECWQLEKVV